MGNLLPHPRIGGRLGDVRHLPRRYRHCSALRGSRPRDPSGKTHAGIFGSNRERWICLESSCREHRQRRLMAHALDALGQRAKRPRAALELGLRMVPPRPWRDLSRQHRRVLAQQHFPHVDLGQPDPLGRRADRFLDPVCQALRAPVRNDSRDGHGPGANLLRGFHARLSRSPRHPCLCVDGFVFRHRMGWDLLGEAGGQCGHHRARIHQTSAPRHDLLRRERGGGDLD